MMNKTQQNMFKLQLDWNHTHQCIVCYREFGCDGKEPHCATPFEEPALCADCLDAEIP